MRLLEIPISNSVAPTEIVRCLADFAVIYCHFLPTFWGRKRRLADAAHRRAMPHRLLSSQSRDSSSIAPKATAVASSQSRETGQPMTRRLERGEVATCATRMIPIGCGAMSRLGLKNTLCARTFAVARQPDFLPNGRRTTLMTAISRSIENLVAQRDRKSGRLDLNQRPHGPEPCALSRLSYAPRVHA